MFRDVPGCSMFLVLSTASIISHTTKYVKEITQNKLTESRKSNSFSTFAVGTSLPDACDKRIKNVARRENLNLNGYLKQCLNDLRVKIYALKCKRRRKFSNQLVNVRAFRLHVCFLSRRSDEEKVKQTKKSFTYHRRGFRTFQE